MKEVGQEAAQRANSMEVPKVQAGIDAGQAQALQRLADQARQRGEAELQRLQSGKTTADEPGEGGGPVDAAHADSKSGPATREPGRLIVALSSSMPMSMVHAYMAQLAGVPEAVVVLRGFVGGAHTVAPTGRWVEEAERVEPGCQQCAHYRIPAVVDPLLYRALGIEQVPAVAYAPGMTDISHCDGESVHVAAIAYGAVSIESAVGSLERGGAVIPAQLKERLRSRGWESKLKKRTD